MPAAAPCEVVIGLDFGTSCTKVIIRTPYERGGRCFAVDFGSHGHDSSSYFCPSILRCSDDGTVAHHPSAAHWIARELKRALMGRAELEIEGPAAPLSLSTPTTAATAYLAWVIRYCQEWFLALQAPSYATDQFNWSVNLGVPSANFDDEATAAEFLHVLCAATQLAWSDDRLTLANAASAYAAHASTIPFSPTQPEAVIEIGTSVPCAVSIVPEVAAEVVGYARSDSRRNGLHLLIDVGAGTLDLSAFVLHERDGDDRYSLLTADVQPLGGWSLHLGRVDSIRELLSDDQASDLNTCDPIIEIPATLGELIKLTKAMHSRTGRFDQGFLDQCRKTMFATITDVRTRRDPRSDRWSSSVPLFVCGGACGMQMYTDALTVVDEMLPELYHRCNGLKLLQIEPPEILAPDFSKDEYRRFTVAWGLSYPSFDIGRIDRPTDIDDVPRAPRPTNGREYPGKEMT